jgi:hypothetical protein
MRRPAAREEGAGKGMTLSEALVVALGMVVVDKLADDAAQVALAQRNDVPQAFLLDRSHVGPVLGAP